MFGNGRRGQLGNKKQEICFCPTKLITDCAIVEIACGMEHTMILDSKGRVHSFGGNSFGQLGLGHKINVDQPVIIKELNNVKNISAGHHSAAITSEESLYIWGTGIFGVYLNPHKFSNIDKVKEVQIGGCFGVALNSDGKLWSWGSNSSGELGLGNTSPIKQPQLIEALRDMYIISISCGNSHVIAITSERTTEMLQTFSKAEDRITMEPNIYDEPYNKISLSERPSPSKDSSNIQMIVSLQKERDYYEGELKKERSRREETQLECDMQKKMISEGKERIDETSSKLRSLEEAITILRQDKATFEEDITQRMASIEIEKRRLAEQEGAKGKIIKEYEI